MDKEFRQKEKCIPWCRQASLPLPDEDEENENVDDENENDEDEEDDDENDEEKEGAFSIGVLQKTLSSSTWLLKLGDSGGYH